MAEVEQMLAVREREVRSVKYSETNAYKIWAKLRVLSSNIGVKESAAVFSVFKTPAMMNLPRPSEDWKACVLIYIFCNMSRIIRVWWRYHSRGGGVTGSLPF